MECSNVSEQRSGKPATKLTHGAVLRYIVRAADLSGFELYFSLLGASGQHAGQDRNRCDSGRKSVG